MLLLYHRLRIRACRSRTATRSGPPSPRTDPSFSPLARGGGARPLPDTPDQTVERDWRQAMPRAEPALSRAPLPLLAVIGAAITTAITTPVTPGGPPPQSGGHGQGALGAGGCAGTTTLRLPLGKPRGFPGVTARSLPRRRSRPTVSMTHRLKSRMR